MLRPAIKGMRHKVFIATKFSPENNSYDNVIKAAERSLYRLQPNILICINFIGLIAKYFLRILYEVWENWFKMEK